MEEVVLFSLDLMWKGMMSIFVVIAAIFAVTTVAGKIKRRDKKEDAPDLTQ